MPSQSRLCLQLVVIAVIFTIVHGLLSVSGPYGPGKREKVAQAYREASKLRSLSTYGEVKDICEKTKVICSEMENEDRLKKAEKEMVDDPWDNLKDTLNL